MSRAIIHSKCVHCLQPIVSGCAYQTLCHACRVAGHIDHLLCPRCCEGVIIDLSGLTYVDEVQDEESAERFNKRFGIISE